MNTILNTAPSGSDELHLDEFEDAQDWYVEQWAVEQGLDPKNTLREVRTAQRRWGRVQQALGAGGGGSTGAAPVSAVAEAQQPHSTELACPPGFAGAIAQFIYQAAPRPVAEVAIVGALGLLAGVCGREWSIPGSGLNIYVVLVARSAVGKEAMHRGVSKIINAARKEYSAAEEFVCFDDFASGPALTKFLVGVPCVVNVAGEIGHKFASMAKARDSETAVRSLRRTMTNLYSKSGRDGIAGGLNYSNQENNAKIDWSVSYSLIGETTPSTFYESITPEMMSDGFMSRFNVVEYTGDRPDKNPAPIDRPDAALVANIVAMMRHAHLLRASSKFQDVAFSDGATALLIDFERECDAAIAAAGDDEGQRQMWNRAHLKVLRIAALLAVADNYLFPSVTMEQVSWAISLIRHDIGVFSKRLRSGDIGEGTDEGRERKLLDICREYLSMTETDLPDYTKPWNDMRRQGWIPRKYLQIRTQRLSAFGKHPRGHKAALDQAIQTAIDNGHLFAISKVRAVESFGFHGNVFGALNLREQE